MKQNLIRGAIQTATFFHDTQHEKGYYEKHLQHVQAFVATQTSDEEVICAAILHDTLEDTRLTFKDLATTFGQRVAFLVDCVTDEPGYETRKERKQKSYWKILASKRGL